MSDNLPVVPVVTRVTSLEIPVAKDPDTGELVRRMFGKLPALLMEMETGYPRGAHLKMEVEVRVRRAFTDEHVAGPHKGELYREHHFTIEQATVIGVYSADEMDPGVGGGLAASNQEEQDDDEDPGADGPTDDDQQGKQDQETDERPEPEEEQDDDDRRTASHDPGF